MPVTNKFTRRAFAAMMLGTAAACSRRVPASNPADTAPAPVQFVEGYGPIEDAGFFLPGIPPEFTQGVNRRMFGQYLGEQRAGTIDVDPYAKFLYLVEPGGTAVRYPVGVGRQGRSLTGGATIKRKRKWPGWTPTANMLRTEPEVYGPFRSGIPGGLASPLGSRALYLYRGDRDTYYRIHGTNALDSIGNSGSAGCIRMFNHDMIDLYERVDVPMTVHIRSAAESLRVDPENYERGIELPPVILAPEDLFGPEGREGLQAPDFDAETRAL